MTKIKFLGALIFILSLVLAYYSKYVANQNEMNIEFLKSINEQKTFTEEISKNIFYIFNNKGTSTKELEKSIKLFVNNINYHEDNLNEIFSKDMQNQRDKIIKQWNQFYRLVQQFRDTIKIDNNPYTNMLIEQLVKDIYKNNLSLMIEFNKLSEIHKKDFEHFMYISKSIQIALFIVLILLLIYFFTQLHDVLGFIQTFLKTSKKIVQKSTIQEVQPISIESNVEDLTKVTDNFNYLVKKIDDSIEYSGKSLQNASASLEQIEKHIEDLLDLISTMDTKNSYDKEIIKKEDILIETLEELTTSVQKLQQLKENLKNFKK